jgi:hypothetical protein
LIYSAVVAETDRQNIRKVTISWCSGSAFSTRLGGTESRQSASGLDPEVLHQLNYMLSRLVDDEILDVEYERTNLDDFGAVDRNGASPDGNASDFPAHQSRTDGGRDDRSSPETAPLEPDGQQSLSTYSG